MPKRRKPSRPGKPAPSPETSRTQLEVKLDPGLLAALRGFTKPDRKEIGDLIETVRESFGNPHAHRGSGTRALGRGLYECRLGLSIRLIFAAYHGLLYFHVIGDHDDVQQFLKAHR